MALGCEIISQPPSIVANITSPAAKIVSRCEIISQPPIALCENFRSCEMTLWHTSAISQPRTPIRRCEMVAKPPHLEILHFGAETPFRSCETNYYSKSTIS